MLSGFFYRTYAKFSKRGNFLRLKISRFGTILIILTLLSFFFGINIRSSSLYRIFSTGLAFLIFAIFFRIFRKRDSINLKITAFFPDQLTAGKSSTYLLKLYNNSERSLKDIKFIPVIKNTIPTKEEFETIKEPGEEKRNFWDRNIYYFRWAWHILNKYRVEIPQIDGINIGADSYTEIKASVFPIRRGKTELTGCYIITKDIFGIFYQYRFFDINEEIVVLPKKIKPDQRIIKISERLVEKSFKKINQMSSKLRTGDFIGLRNYHPGDPLKNISWKLWAKTGKPAVIEKAVEKVSEFNIILINPRSSTEDDIILKFEDMLSYLISIIEEYQKRKFTVNFFYSHKNGIKKISASAENGKYPQLYNMISILEPDYTSDIYRYLNDLKRNINSRSNVLIADLNNNKEILRSLTGYFRNFIILDDRGSNNKNTYKIPRINDIIKQVNLP